MTVSETDWALALRTAADRVLDARPSARDRVAAQQRDHVGVRFALARADEARLEYRTMIAARRVYDYDPYVYPFRAELEAALARTMFRDRWRQVWRDTLDVRRDVHLAACGYVNLADSPCSEPAAGKRQRRTTSELRGQVLELARRGLVAAAIADTLNLSDRRVREIMSQTPENGGRKPADRAKNFAAKADPQVNGHRFGRNGLERAVGQLALDVPERIAAPA